MMMNGLPGNSHPAARSRSAIHRDEAGETNPVVFDCEWSISERDEMLEVVEVLARSQNDSIQRCIMIVC